MRVSWCPKATLPRYATRSPVCWRIGSCAQSLVGAVVSACSGAIRTNASPNKQSMLTDWRWVLSGDDLMNRLIEVRALGIGVLAAVLLGACAQSAPAQSGSAPAA